MNEKSYLNKTIFVFAIQSCFWKINFFDLDTGLAWLPDSRALGLAAMPNLDSFGLKLMPYQHTLGQAAMPDPSALGSTHMPAPWYLCLANPIYLGLTPK